MVAFAHSATAAHSKYALFFPSTKCDWIFMQKKSLLSIIAQSFGASAAPSGVNKQSMMPLTEIEIMAVAGGPQIINEPEGPE